MQVIVSNDTDTKYCPEFGKYCGYSWVSVEISLPSDDIESCAVWEKIQKWLSEYPSVLRCKGYFRRKYTEGVTQYFYYLQIEENSENEGIEIALLFKMIFG